MSPIRQRPARRTLLLVSVLAGLGVAACAQRQTAGESAGRDPVSTITDPRSAPASFADFDAWRGRPGDHAQGMALAEARAAEMVDLIRRDPGRALALAMPTAERDRLPPDIRAEVEERIDAEGMFATVASCNHGEEGHAGCRIDHQTLVDGVSRRAYLDDARRFPMYAEQARIRGVALKGHMAMAEVEVPAMEDQAEVQVAALTAAAAASIPVLDPANPPSGLTPPTEPYAEYTGTLFRHQYGPKTMMVFLALPSDAPDWSSPPAFATLNSQLTTTSQWFYDLSYGLTWFGPKIRFVGQPNQLTVPPLVVTPVLRLPQPKSYYYDNFGLYVSDSANALRALGGEWGSNGTKDSAHFDRWVMMSTVDLIPSTGVAFPGSRPSIGGVGGSVGLHEIGHNWGVIHANSWGVPAGNQPRSPTGSHGEYGDGRDIMGGGSGGDFMNPLFLDQLGFIRRSEGEVVVAEGDTVHRLFDRLDPHARNPVSNVRGVVIPITGLGRYDKRVMLGFAHTPGPEGLPSRPSWERTAVTVHSGGTSPQNNNNDGSHRLDTSPGSRQGSLDRDDSAVPIGRTWSEPANVNGTHPGFHVTPLRRGSSVGPTGRTHEWIDVRVVIGQPAGNRAPTASISTTNATPAVGQDTTLRATANDPDGDALAYRWTFGDDTWSTTSTPVIAKRWAVPGLYRVDCEVSDMRGGVTTASMWVDAGGTGRILPVSPGAVLDGLEYTAYEGWWTRLPDFARQRPLAEGVAAQARLAPRGRNDGFGTVYTGFLRVPADDVYTFTLTADDSALVRIAGRVVVDKQGTTSGDTFATGNLFLGAGLHPIEIQLAHRDGNESLRLEWNTLTMAKVEIPATAFARPSRVGDAAPVVTLQVPGGTMVARGGTASFTATATDADDAIVTVQYFWNRALIGEATAAPWTVAWPELWPGDKPVVAVARAADGRWAVSAPATVSVAAPPAARSIGINLVGDAGSGGVLSTDRVLGAQHRHGWWNNVSGSRTTVGSLRNGAGTVTAASVTTDFYNANGYVSAQAETADPDGAMLDGGLWTRDTGVAARVSVSGLPWSVSDVYVYVDASFGASQDTSLGAYTIGGTTRYIRNSLTTADQIGDWPVYDTWVGFREATATTTAAPVGQQLGNYLVFRNVAGSAITLDVQTQRPVNGVQIVEAGGTSGPINAAPTVTMPAEVAPATLVIP